MTLDELIYQLEELRSTIGGDTRVVAYEDMSGDYCHFELLVPDDLHIFGNHVIVINTTYQVDKQTLEVGRGEEG